MKYINRSSVCEGSMKSARVHRLVKAFVDQVSDKKKKNIHSRTYRSLIDQSNFNWI